MEYDGTGALQQLGYPGGRVVSFYRDALRRIDKIRDGAFQALPPASYLVGFSYQGPGLVNGITRASGAGASTTYTYDGLKRNTGIAHRDALLARISEYVYGFDLMGNRTSERRTHADLEDRYAYDSLYRLVQYQRGHDGAGAAFTRDYALDKVGSRVEVLEGGVPVQYLRSELHEYTTIGGVARTHDANGNVVGADQKSFSFDAEDRLVRCVTATATVEYAYDALGRRIEKRVQPGTTTRFFYEGDEVIEEQTTAGTTLATYVSGDGIDDWLSMRTAAGIDYYYHHKALGTVSEVTDAGGNLVEQYRYDDYGVVEIRDGSGNTLATSAVGNRFLFTGREWEPETGLYFYRARFYDPKTGRFIGRDPKGLWGDDGNLGNGYTYAGNNPQKYLDPWGKDGDDHPALTSEEYERLESDDPEKLQEFYRGFLDRYAPTIREAADFYGIPPWLLASVILGERINMDDNYLCFREDTLEQLGFGQSVGLAQIVVSVALQYGLTPGQRQKRFVDISFHVTREVQESPEEAVRRELLDPETNIWASARYIAILAWKASAAPKVPGAFGVFRFSILTTSVLRILFYGDSYVCPVFADFAWDSLKPGNEPTVAKRLKLVRFFSAAHNDNSVTEFGTTTGLRQAQWAGAAYRDLVKFGMLEEYGLQKR